MTLVLLMMVIITLFYADYQPTIYSKEGEKGNNANNNVIPIYTKGLTSKEEIVALQYHDLDFCQSEKKETSHGTLQDGLFGPVRTPYFVTFLHDRPCKVLCTKSYDRDHTTLTRQKLDDLKMAISRNYEHRWFVDNLPVKWCYSVGDGKRRCRNSFPVGCHVTKDKNTCEPILMNAKNDTYYLFNHMDLEFIYHTEEKEEGEAGANMGRILFVQVKPASMNHRTSDLSFGSRNCNTYNNQLELPVSMDNVDKFHITYTYSVNFYKNHTMDYPSKWARIIDLMFD